MQVRNKTNKGKDEIKRHAANLIEAIFEMQRLVKDERAFFTELLNQEIKAAQRAGGVPLTKELKNYIKQIKN